MYYLYLDESGDPRRYRDENGNIRFRSSRYFTIAGIIVDEHAKQQFHDKYNEIINEFFNGITLSQNFKLHYNKLRMNMPPFDHLDRRQKWKLENDVFDAINNIECKLMSVTINIENHFPKYENQGLRPIHPTAYALHLIRERFEYFLRDEHSDGKVIYERYNAELRKKMEIEISILLRTTNFPRPTNFSNQIVIVEDGDPTKEPMLQFADFFAYIPWIKKTSNANWVAFREKYYNLYALNTYSGNVEIE